MQAAAISMIICHPMDPDTSIDSRTGYTCAKPHITAGLSGGDVSAWTLTSARVEGVRTQWETCWGTLQACIMLKARDYTGPSLFRSFVLAYQATTSGKYATLDKDRNIAYLADCRSTCIQSPDCCVRVALGCHCFI